MRQRVLVLVSCTILIVTGPARAQSTPESPCSTQPNAEQFGQAYSPLAEMLEIEGRATLDCHLAA